MLNYEFPPLGGGASPVSFELSKGYVSLGHHVDVVTMGFMGLPDFEKKDGINIFRVKSWRSKKEICHPWEQLTYVISAKRFLREHLKNNQYDVCHCHFIIPTGIIALWLKKNYGIPYVITSHGSDVPGYNPDRFKFLHRFTKPTIRSICKDAKVITVPSKYLAGLIKKELGNYNIKVIPNGIDINKFKPKKKKKIILSTGRLLPRKGFQYLIRAVSDEDFGYTVHIVGDGPMISELKKLAKDSKTKIVFHGWLDNNSNKFRNLLESAAIYVLVSEKENASVSLLEAMSAGCAVIASNVAGSPETVGKAGIIVKPKDCKDITSSIKNLISNNKLSNSLQKESRKMITKKYDNNLIFKSYLKVLI